MTDEITTPANPVMDNCTQCGRPYKGHEDKTCGEMIAQDNQPTPKE
jgi:hypothetical protein